MNRPRAATLAAVVALGLVAGCSSGGDPISSQPVSTVTQIVETPGPVTTKTVKVPGPTVTKTVIEPGGGPGSQPGDFAPSMQRDILDNGWAARSRSEKKDLCSAWTTTPEVALDALLESSGPGFDRPIVSKWFDKTCN